MMKRKAVFTKLEPSYFFATIAKKRVEFEANNRDKKVISLGIGDAVLPLVPGLKKPFNSLVDQMLSKEGFIGYGDAQGSSKLRDVITRQCYQGVIEKSEIFISNGAKGLLSWLQTFFSQASSVGIISPTYPVYADGSMMQGVKTIHYLPLLEENQFCYDLEKAPDIDILYLCHPNNPTGTVLSRDQLTKWVAICKQRGIILIVDNAYSAYIQSKDTCKSIYEIPGASEVAIEINSFSKSLGFSGVRGGWLVFPKALRYVDKTSMYPDWSRFYGTVFNGAGIFSQTGMLAFFEKDVQLQAKAQADYYMDNARRLKTVFEKLGFTTYGGENAPYVWVSVGRIKSWDFFQFLLEERYIVITPGIGFGDSGEYFIRLSAFLTKEDLSEVEKRLLGSPLPLHKLHAAQKLPV